VIATGPEQEDQVDHEIPDATLVTTVTLVAIIEAGTVVVDPRLLAEVATVMPAALAGRELAGAEQTVETADASATTVADPETTSVTTGIIAITAIEGIIEDSDEVPGEDRDLLWSVVEMMVDAVAVEITDPLVEVDMSHVIESENERENEIDSAMREGAGAARFAAEARVPRRAGAEVDRILPDPLHAPQDRHPVLLVLPVARRLDPVLSPALDPESATTILMHLPPTIIVAIITIAEVHPHRTVEAVPTHEAVVRAAEAEALQTTPKTTTREHNSQTMCFW
jgi:hypothetical protein